MTFLRPEEAAEFLRVSEDTLRRYRYSGILVEGSHYTKINSRVVRYIREALEAWMRGEVPRRRPGRPRKEVAQ